MSLELKTQRSKHVRAIVVFFKPFAVAVFRSMQSCRRPMKPKHRCSDRFAARGCPLRRWALFELQRPGLPAPIIISAVLPISLLLISLIDVLFSDSLQKTCTYQMAGIHIPMKPRVDNRLLTVCRQCWGRHELVKMWYSWCCLDSARDICRYSRSGCLPIPLTTI
jgi:hypothetical protein